MADNEQAAARQALHQHRDEVRARRVSLMRAMGVELKAWRADAGIQQKTVGDAACVSATVVRRIEKGDYESSPPSSLIRGIRELKGPWQEILRLREEYLGAQGEQLKIDNLLKRSTLPLNSKGEIVGSTPAPSRKIGLPVRPELIGRTAELVDLTDYIRDANAGITTIVGPGGVGKTALAIALAYALEFDTEATFFIDLSDLAPEQVGVAELCAQMEIPTTAHNDLRAITSLLGDSRNLVLLDNCEHVIEVITRVILSLQLSCPNTRFLATSREPLRIAQERIHSVRGLELNELAQDGDAMTLLDLKVMSSRGHGLAPEEAMVARTLCRNLDGIPLALELAAAMSRLMSLQEIAQNISTMVASFAGNRVSLRHLSMNSAVAWSWGLLTPEEQRCLQMVVSLNTSVRLATIDAMLQSTSVELVRSLVDKSLVVAVPIPDGAGPTRYKVLRVIREFVLTQSDCEATITSQTLAGRWLREFTNVDEVELQAHETGLTLLQEASLIAFILTSGIDPRLRIEVALNVWGLLDATPTLLEAGIEALRLAMDPDVSLADVVRGRALGALSILYEFKGDHQSKMLTARQSLEVRRHLGDPVQTSYALGHLAAAYLNLGNFTKVFETCAEIERLDGVGESMLGQSYATRARAHFGRFEIDDAAYWLKKAIDLRLAEREGAAAGVDLVLLSAIQRGLREFESAIASAHLALELIAEYRLLLRAEATLALAAVLNSTNQTDDALDLLSDFVGTHESDLDEDWRLLFEAARVWLWIGRNTLGACRMIEELLIAFSRETVEGWDHVIALLCGEIAKISGRKEQEARFIARYAHVHERNPRRAFIFFDEFVEYRHLIEGGAVSGRDADPSTREFERSIKVVTLEEIRDFVRSFADSRIA